MSIGLDTSVVLRLLVGEPADQATIAWAFVTDAAVTRTGAVRVADLVIGETYFALRHHYHVPEAEALAALSGLAGDVRFDVSDAARRALAAARSSRGAPGFMDRMIHAAYADIGAPLVTFDRDAGRLSGAFLLR